MSDPGGITVESPERLVSELHRADLLLRRYLSRWWEERRPGDTEFRGLFVSDEAVDELLARPEADATVPDDSATRTDRAIERALGGVTDRIEAHRDRAESPTRLTRLVREYDLDRTELDVLVLALAPDLDLKYHKVYGYLQDDVTRVRPTVGLLVRVLTRDDASAFAARGRFGHGSTLVDEGLLTVGETDGTLLGRTVGVPERVGSFLVGGSGLPASLADVATVSAPDGSLEEVHLDEESLERLATVSSGMATASADPPMAALVGPDSATAELAAEAMVPTAHQLLRVDAASLVARDGAVDDLRREARLRPDLVVHVRDLDGLDDGPDAGDRDGVVELLRALDQVPAPVVLTGDVAVRPRLAAAVDAHALRIVELPIPGRERRAAIWADASLPETVDTDTVADAYRLTTDEIADAVATAHAIADGTPDDEALAEACRSLSGRRLDEHARRVEPTYDWDDIVLPPETEARLREAAAGLRQRGTVFESWGFADRYGRGTGVTLLFTGPSGTGKTMAAEVLATDVGLPLYAVDLATMLSKYIGETEENLRQVFDAAERANAVLFFDEADALFGERSEVSDAHDRYANVEVDYLLQRLEDHDGCVVLASNLAENIDDAFRRRVDVAVEFPYPDREARAEIWADAFPDATPTGELDVEFLAEFDLTGGNIATVATTAAFLAAEEDDRVEMAHAVRALRRELQKEGTLFDVEAFDEYGRHLRGER